MEQYSEILSTNYWGNSVGAWALAMFGILSALVFSKLVFQVLKKVGTTLASKTKTNLDDAIFDAVEDVADFATVIAVLLMVCSMISDSRAEGGCKPTACSY